MIEECISDAYVALRVLKIYWIDFVRHGRGAGFAFDLALFEILDGDVAPHVAVEIKQHLIEAHLCVAEFSDVVVGFDLRSPRVIRQAQAFDKLPRQVRPIQIWVCDQMGVEIANGSIEFTQNGRLAELLVLSL